jgi:SAM-dependent methyltransferase
MGKIQMDLSPTKRFSSRVDDYVKYRPSYPQVLFEFLDQELQLCRGCRVADVGSGTGIFSRQLVDRGIEVFGIEPNREMRLAAEAALRSPLFHSIDATAESTMLADRSVDFVTAAQAFHWFDRQQAKLEFRRILKPEGLTLLIWNERIEVGDPFAEDYERAICTYCEDYPVVKRKNMSAMNVFDQFYEPGFQRVTFANVQYFDFEGLQGRLMSSSYAPLPGHPGHDPLSSELRRIFDLHADQGKVRMAYETSLYYGSV